MCPRQRPFHYWVISCRPSRTGGISISKIHPPGLKAARNPFCLSWLGFYRHVVSCLIFRLLWAHHHYSFHIFTNKIPYTTPTALARHGGIWDLLPTAVPVRISIGRLDRKSLGKSMAILSKFFDVIETVWRAFCSVRQSCLALKIPNPGIEHRRYCRLESFANQPVDFGLLGSCDFTCLQWILVLLCFIATGPRFQSFQASTLSLVNLSWKSRKVFRCCGPYSKYKASLTPRSWVKGACLKYIIQVSSEETGHSPDVRWEFRNTSHAKKSRVCESFPGLWEKPEGKSLLMPKLFQII